MRNIILSLSVQVRERYSELLYTKEITEVEPIQQIQLLPTFQICDLKSPMRCQKEMGRTGKHRIYPTLFIRIFSTVTPNVSISHISNFHHVTYL